MFPRSGHGSAKSPKFRVTANPESPYGPCVELGFARTLSVLLEGTNLSHKLLKCGIAAAVLGIALWAAPAQAGVAGALAASPAPDVTSEVTEVRWRCGPFRCNGHPGWGGYVPPYAVAWGPPRYRGCYWGRGMWGAWVHVCPP